MTYALKRIKKRLYRLMNALNPRARARRRLYEHFASSPEGERIIAYRNALKLQRLIRASGARRVLELGTGIGASTAFIASALPEGGTLTTVEQNETYCRAAQALIPRELHHKISFVYSPPRAFSVTLGNATLHLSGYRELPTEHGPFDMVLIDGPSAFEENGTLISLPNGDLFRLLPHLAHNALILVDGRKDAVLLYRTHLADALTLLADTAYYALFRQK